MFISKKELIIIANARNLFLSNFKSVKRVIMAVLDFLPKSWQINNLLNVKNKYNVIVFA